MKVKGRFAPIRDGLLEHMYGITPMEAKIYLMQHLVAKRTGPDRGKVFTNLSELSRLAGHKREHVRRAVHGLKRKEYIKPIEGGWLIVNYNGDNPAKVARKGPCPKKGHGPKGARKWPEKGQGGGPKRARKVARKGPDDGCKARERKQDNLPLNDLNDKKDVNDKRRKAPDSTQVESWPTWYPGITWNKKIRQVEMTDEARESLSEHLRNIAEQEDLSPLTMREAQRSWGRLNGYLMRNRQCTGPKSLPPIAVNWFENDLRDERRIRGPTSKARRIDDVFDEAIRKAEEEQGGKKLTE